MSDTVFRAKSEPVVNSEEVLPVSHIPPIKSIDNDIEVPYSDYTQQKGHPYSVDYFELGDTWEVYNSEIESIENYLKYKIEQGDIANSLSAVKNELKNIEKINNLRGEERATLKTGVMSAYAKFLLESAGIKQNIKKYGTRF